MMYAYSSMECNRHNCHFRPFFALFPYYWPQKLKLGKMYKKPGYIILLYMCTINQDLCCMVLEIWSATDNFFILWAIFYPFTPLTAWKLKISKVKKKPGDIIILQKCTKNLDHRLYLSWDMAHDRCNCYFHFGQYFALLPPPPNSPKNENFKTMKKNTWRYHHFTIAPKIMIIYML